MRVETILKLAEEFLDHCTLLPRIGSKEQIVLPTHHQIFRGIPSCFSRSL